jgi:hypothetical protein
MIAACEVEADATPTTKLLVEMSPSLAPSVAARSHPVRFPRCNSPCITNFFIDANQMLPINPPEAVLS